MSMKMIAGGSGGGGYTAPVNTTRDNAPITLDDLNKGTVTFNQILTVIHAAAYHSHDEDVVALLPSIPPTLDPTSRVSQDVTKAVQDFYDFDPSVYACSGLLVSPPDEDKTEAALARDVVAAERDKATFGPRSPIGFPCGDPVSPDGPDLKDLKASLTRINSDVTAARPYTVLHPSTWGWTWPGNW